MNWDEENLKQKFEGYEVTPSSRVWENIDKELSNKTWTKWPIWALSSLLLLSSLGGGYFYWQDYARHSQHQLANNDQTVQERSTSERTSSTSDEDNPEKQNIISNTEKSNWNTQQSKEPKDQGYTSEGNNSGGKNKKADANQSQGAGNVPKDAKGNKVNAGNQNTENQKDNGKSSGPVVNEEMKTKQNPQAQETETGKSGEDKGRNAFANSTNNNFLSSLPLLTEAKVQEVYVNPSKARQFETPNSIDSQLREEGIIGSNSKWALGVEAGPFQQNHQYSLKESTQEDRLSTIKKSESVAWGYGININGYWTFADNWQLQFGLGYERLNQQFSHSYERSYESNIPNSDGVEFITENIKFENTNQFDFLRMPMAIRYQLLDSRLSCFISPGVEVNALTNAKAMVLGVTEKEVFNLVNDDIRPMKTYTLDYTLNISAQYALDDHFSIMVRPFGQIGSGSIYSDDFAVEKQAYQFGVNAGLIYGF